MCAVRIRKGLPNARPAGYDSATGAPSLSSARIRAFHENSVNEEKVPFGNPAGSHHKAPRLLTFEFSCGALAGTVASAARKAILSETAGAALTQHNHGTACIDGDGAEFPHPPDLAECGMRFEPKHLA